MVVAVLRASKGGYGYRAPPSPPSVSLPHSRKLRIHQGVSPLGHEAPALRCVLPAYPQKGGESVRATLYAHLVAVCVVCVCVCVLWIVCARAAARVVMCGVAICARALLLRCVYV